MKTKIYFLITFFFLSQANAQVLFQDDFSGDLSAWTAEGDFTENWKITDTNNAGGTAPELTYKGKYPATAPDKSCRFISPAADLSDYPGQSLMLRFCQKAEYVSFIDLGVATTSDGGATWNNVWTYTQDSEQQMFVLIDNSDIGASNFQFAFTCSGNFQELKNWYIDDVILSIAEDNNVYLEAVACGEKSVNIKEGNTVGLSFKNIGIKSISSMEICYRVDDNETVMEIKTGLDVAPFEKSSLTFQEAITGKELGEHSVKVWITKVNGSPVTERALYDSYTVTAVPAILSKKRAVFEEFTSSTCGPCAGLNQHLDPLLKAAGDKVVVTKYQMNWPSPGDIYYIEDCRLRSAFYGGVTGVPAPYIMGEHIWENTYKETAEMIAAMAEEIVTQPALVDVKAIFSLTDKFIKTEIHLFPYVSGEYLLAVSVNEKETTGNASTNGETEFYHVLMKSLSDGNGQIVTFTEGELFTIILEGDLSDTNIEEFDDLEVAVFVQSPTSKEILNGAYAVETILPPGMPGNLQAGADGTTVTLTWDAPSPGTGVTGYKLFRDAYLIAEDITGTSYSDKGLANGDYLYHLTAVYSDIESAYVSVTASVVVSISAPTGVEVTTTDKKIFNITWNASPEDYIEGYNVYREGTKINREIIESTSYIDEAPYEGEYCYRIVAVAGMGASQPSDKACAGPVAIENAGANGSLKIYPNPTGGILRVTNGTTEIESIQLFDLSGRVLYQKDNVNTTECTMDISGFTHGMYILKVDGKSVKLIKR